MPSTQKSKARPAARPRANAATRARFEKNHRAIGRLTKSLDSAQKDLAAIGTGAGDLRKDVAKRLREARKDVTKMGNTLRRDLERLQSKDSRSASKKAKPKKAKARRAKTSKPRARAKSSRAKAGTTRAKSTRAKSATKSRARRKSA
jgi:hypothetical protein